MTHLRILFLCLIAGGLLAQTTRGAADLAPLDLKDGYVLPLRAHESIRMDSHEVGIRLRKTTYTVDAVFRLYNTGVTTTQWVGVPQYLRGSSFRASLFRFRAWIDGQHVAFSPAGDISLRRPAYGDVPLPLIHEWMAAAVTFPGHSVTTIRVKYTTSLDYRDNGGCYIFGNSGYWKDNVGNFVITVDSTEIGETMKMKVGFPDVSGGRMMTEHLQRYEAGSLKPGRAHSFYFNFSSK